MTAGGTRQEGEGREGGGWKGDERMEEEDGVVQEREREESGDERERRE